MKKTLQTNIAGILFHIEEDAFERLSAYLDSIKKYFSAYEDSEEIVADIEARIAEKFIGKNKPDALPVVTDADVENLMKSMGGVTDFEAMEEETAYSSETKTETNKESSSTKEKDFEGTRKLYRDTKRKALGGVLAGLANYFKVDVVWFRIIFLVAFLGLAESGIGPSLFIAYIICWIAFPPNENLNELTNIRKFYRDPESKVLGGVASGLANYFGLDVAIIRLIFVALTALFGIGILAYLIIWVAAPMAHSLTQKMEMKGEAVTLENINTNVQQNLNAANIPTKKKESTIATLLLLPFRIIGAVFTALGRGLGSLAPVFRVLFGIFLCIMGLSLTIAAVGFTAAFFGINNNIDWFSTNTPFEHFANELPQHTGLFLFLSLGLPALAVILSGIILISNRAVGNKNFWLTSLGLWIIGIIGVSAIAGKYSLNYAKRGHVEEVEKLKINGDVLYLMVNGNDDYNDMDFHTRIVIEESDSDEIEIVKNYHASGASRNEAEENAKLLSYNYALKDSLLIFNDRAILKPGAKFRDQKLSITLKVPSNKKIKISEDFARHLLANTWTIKEKYGMSDEDFSKLSFKINDDELECLECDPLSDEEKEAFKERNDWNDDNDREFENYGSHQSEFKLSNFNGISAGSNIIVKVRQGEEYKVEAFTERERDLEDLDLDIRSGILRIGFKDRFISDRGQVNVMITMPIVEVIELSGASKLKLLNFKNCKTVKLDISGASMAKIDIEAEKVELEASGASKLDLIGEVKTLEVDIAGASTLTADRAEIAEAKVDASGASKASFGKVEKLSSETSGASKVTNE